MGGISGPGGLTRNPFEKRVMTFDEPATLPFGQRRFRHVFVLCTGRCGSVSFARACSHFTNYTAGHESNRNRGTARLAYPVGHIEIDNRLAWFLGGLDERYGRDAFYVHLLRDEERVAQSYDRRWHLNASMVRGFDESICMHHEPGPEAARDLAATVNANIRAFLRHKPHVITGDIDDVQSWFPRFVSAIGAAGDVDAALAEFAIRHNMSKAPTGSESGIAENRQSRESRPVARLQKECQKLTVEVARLEKEGQKLTAEVARLQKDGQKLTAEVARLQEKVRKARRTNWLLAAPWLIAAAPIAIPAAWLATRRRRDGDTRNTSGGLRCPRFPSLPTQSRRTVVYDAFLAHRAGEPKRAAAILDRAGTACPPGARDLFRAMAAHSDVEWLAATNAWAAVAAIPEISLRPGPGPRFERLQLAPAEPVLSHDKVSVIMPSYNAVQTIERAARSILTQSWQNLELIIVDDASCDGTANVADRLAAEDARVRVLRNPINVGPYVSKNRALLVATGRYVTGHDADDIALPTRIADQMQPMRDDASCTASIGYMVRLDQNGVFSYPAKVGKISYDGVARMAMISLLIERKVLLERLGFWDTVRFGADSEMLARVTAFMGPGLRHVCKVVMLCLNAEGSLTNHAEHGINLLEGVSPVRKAYREAWAAWHAATPADEQRLPFPHLERRFPAPQAMLVSEAALEAVIKADRLAGRRQAA